MTFGDEESDKPHGVEVLFPQMNEPTGTEDEESAKNAKRQACLLKNSKVSKMVGTSMRKINTDRPRSCMLPQPVIVLLSVDR